DELDLGSAFARALGADAGGGDGDLLDGVGAGHHLGEEAVVGAEHVVLNVNAVEGDVNCAFGKAVDRGGAGGSGRLGAGLGDDQVQQVAGGDGQLDELAADEGGADGGAGGLNDIGRAGDLDALGEGAHFEPDVDGGGDGGVELDVVHGAG